MAPANYNQGIAKFYKLYQHCSSINLIVKRREAAIFAFNHLKTSFITAPILKHLDPNCPFVLELDAFDAAVGAMLSQHHGQLEKLYPCAYCFIRKLTEAECNYDISNKEVFSIKAAMEEWRH